MALNCAGSRVSMSVSHATTSVRLSWASARRWGLRAAPPTAAPADTLRNERRFMGRAMRVSSSRSFIDRLRPKEDVLRPLQVIVVELADQLLPGWRGDVLLVLLDVTHLDLLDVVPARALGAGDRSFDPMRRVADDARQRLRHLVIVLAQPLLVGGGIDASLERRDHVPHLHRSPSSGVVAPLNRRRRVRSSRAYRPPPERGLARRRGRSRPPARRRGPRPARPAERRCWFPARSPSRHGRGPPA